MTGQIQHMHEMNTKLTDENNALKGNATKEQATLQQENKRLESVVHQVSRRLTDENNAIKAQRDDCLTLWHKMQKLLEKVRG